MRFHFSQAALLAAITLLQSACRSTPPSARSPSPTQQAILQRASSYQLVDVRQVIPNLCVDLRYKSKDNVARQPVYPADMPSLLRVSTAHKLAQAQRLLNQQGYGLCLWDAWRPPEAQIALISKAPHPELFMDPATDWSGHCAGVSVDVTLVNAKGKPQKMPTDHDELSPHTSYHYEGKSSKISRNLHRLQAAMHHAGFSLLSGEWWHFDDLDFIAQPTPIIFAHQLGITLPELR
jgi:D-alanyl-D-alanine dipeptidase